MRAERRFPVHSDLGRRPKYLPMSVPWSLLAPHEAQAERNHGQSLERLAERGGLCPQEMWCVFNDKGLAERPSLELAEKWLKVVSMSPSEREAFLFTELSTIARQVEMHHGLPATCGFDVLRRVVETMPIGETNHEVFAAAVTWHREQHGCARVG